jgi:hypothetical protein
MKKILFITATIFALASCSKKDNPVPAPEPTPDAYATFKVDATPRWENGSTVEKSDTTTYTFLVDEGGQLFSSAKYKIGRIVSDGSKYEIIEFSGQPAVGKPAEAAIRTESATTPLYSLEILKVENRKIWLVFKESISGAERRIVQ